VSDIVFSDLYPVKNRLKGIIPTASIWDTAPTNLERCTDLDWDTPTGTGDKVMGAAGDVGHITFNMGAEYKVMIRGKIGIWTAIATAFYIYLDIWDGVNWVTNPYAIYYNVVSSERIGPLITFNFKAQIFRLRFFLTAAGTGYVRLYEVQVIDLGMP